MKVINYRCFLAQVLGVAMLAAGCESTSNPPAAASEKGAHDPSKVAYMDSRVAQSITYTGLQESSLPDGRLEVAVNLRNQLNRRIQVEVQCVYKDIQGFSTGDETPWQTLILTENSQETLRFVSLNNLARTYTVRVREAH